MSWAEVGQIAATAIVSAGGVGFVVYCAVKSCVKYIADALAKKYEAKLAQELEKYKSDLSKKEYVSKTRFDTEFQIYRDLSIAFFDLVKEVNALIPYGMTLRPADKQEREKLENKQLQEASRIAHDAQDTLNKNAPFIPEPFYDAYDSILRKCFIQIDVIREKFNVGNMCPDKGKPKFEDYCRTNEINQDFRNNNNAIREYLASLDVIE